MPFPFSLLVLAYLVGCIGIVCYVAYCLLRYQTLSGRTAVGALITLLPAYILIVSGIAADEIDLNPLIKSRHQLIGTYSFGGQSLTLKADGTFTSTGLFSTASGTWTLGTFTLNLSGSAISPRIVTCNGDFCIAPYYDDVDAPIGLLLKKSKLTPPEGR
jgi:hypothetical protein